MTVLLGNVHVEAVAGPEDLGAVLAAVAQAVGEVDVLDMLAHVGPVTRRFAAERALVENVAIEVQSFQVVVKLLGASMNSTCSCSCPSFASTN